MILQRVPIWPELLSFIDTIWVFENSVGVPVEDSRVIVPNGKPKFIYSYQNALSAIENGFRTAYREQDVLFIGIWDKPVQIASDASTTGTIGVELTPQGLHRFTRLPAHEVVNRIFSFSDIYGLPGKHITERLANTPGVAAKLTVLQEFLVQLVNITSRSNVIIDASVNLIKSTDGLVGMAELEKKTGYSKRYIDILFKNHLGISPKTLAGIVRFQRLYHAWANNPNGRFYDERAYELYYDQTHFIKEFKRFSGYSPKQYAKMKNEFGRIFYQD